VQYTPICSQLDSWLYWATRGAHRTLTAYYDATVSGEGQASLSGGQDVYLVASTVLALGNDVRHPEPENTDRLLRFGWFSLGDEFDIGDGTIFYWRPPVWIDWTQQIWTPVGSTLGGTPITVLSRFVRWHINDGGSLHLWVAGL